MRKKREGYNVIKMDTFVINKTCNKRAKKKTLTNNCCKGDVGIRKKLRRHAGR